MQPNTAPNSMSAEVLGLAAVVPLLKTSSKHGALTKSDMIQAATCSMALHTT